MRRGRQQFTLAGTVGLSISGLASLERDLR